MAVDTLQTVLFALCLLLSAAMLFLLFRRQKALETSLAPVAEGRGRVLDTVIVLLFFIGVFITPMYIRAPFLFKPLKLYAYLNYPCILALLLSFVRFRFWSRTDFVFFTLWLLLYIPLSVSNRNLQESTALIAMFHTFLPVFVVLYKMDQHSRRKTLGLFLILFDIFILLLLIIGVEEYLSGKYLLRAIRDWMAGLGLDTAEYNLFVDDHRFGFIWGHPLSNALFFNSFFVLNVVYLRSAGRKCPAPLFFAIALAGVLLSSSKTGITVCFLLLIVTNWKYKKWFLLIIPVLAVLYFLGAFNGIITRFTSTDLTTGRLEALEGYFSTGVSPFRLLSGYSSNMVFRAAEPAHPYRAAFEFPFLMFAFDYGILYSLVWVGGLYLYAAIRFLRKKKVFALLCFTLLFAQTNTYNGLALRNQDFCLYCCFITMMLINMAEMDPKPPEQSK